MQTFTTNEVADMLHTSRKTLQMLREEGALEGIKGRSWFYTEKEIAAFTEKFKGHSFTDREEVRKVIRNENRY